MSPYNQPLWTQTTNVLFPPSPSQEPFDAEQELPMQDEDVDDIDFDVGSFLK